MIEREPDFETTIYDYAVRFFGTGDNWVVYIGDGMYRRDARLSFEGTLAGAISFAKEHIGNWRNIISGKTVRELYAKGGIYTTTNNQ